MNSRSLALILILLSIPTNARAADNVKNRESAAKYMAKAFSTVGIHRMYVPDFCDGSSRPDAHGAFFAATFSDLLAKRAKGFALVSRIDAHRFLQQNNLTDCDLSRPEILSKFSSEFSVDSILSASVLLTENSYSMNFVLRDLAGTELSRFPYREPCDAETEGAFPPTASPSGWPFYFPMLDGVVLPKGIYMPNVDPRIAGGVTGVAILSGLVTTNGKIEQIRVVKGLKPKIDSAAIETLKLWRLVPAKGPDGSAIPVRIPLDFNFYQM